MSKSTQLEPTVETLKQQDGDVMKANSLFEGVKKPREAALDSEFIKYMAILRTEQVQKIQTGFQDYSLRGFVDSVVKKIDHGQWDSLSEKAIHWNYSTTSPSFMNGPLGSLLERKKTRKPIARDKEEALVKPKEIYDTEADINSEATKRVETLYKYLEKKKKMPFWEFVFDPTSYGRTIENIFHYSFLIRDGYASISNEDGDAVSELANPPDDDLNSEGVEKYQCILRFDYKMWQQLKSNPKLKTPYLPPPPEDPYKQRR